MDNRVLITYATKHGATAEIAEQIAEVMQQAGLSSDVMPVERVNNLTPYKAIVLGSAVYIGQWRKEAAKFLETNEKQLAKLPVWFFSSGPTGEGNAVELMQGWRFPQALQAIADHIKPRDIVVFHGVLDTQKLNLAERVVIKGVKAPIGDFRDEDVIGAWANGIVDALKKEGW